MADLNSNLTSDHRQYQRHFSENPAVLVEANSWTCPLCHRLVEAYPKEYSLPNSPRTLRIIIRPRRCGCPGEREYYASLEKMEAEERGRAAWELVLKRAGLVGWLGKATFDSFRVRTDWSRAMQCKADVERYAAAMFNGGLVKGGKPAPWLILYGNYGTGKSHLAAALVRHAVEQNWRGVYFRVWPEYLDRIKATFDEDNNTGETEYDIIAELQQGRLVVIDDIDKQPATEWAKKVLYTALNHRYNENLPTVLTFNYGPSDMKGYHLALVDYLGEAVLDRMIGAAYYLVEFDGPSYRSQVQWRAKAA